MWPSSPTVVGAMNSSVSPRAVGAAHGLHPALLVMGGVPVDEQVVGGLDSLPAAVAVHGIPAADYGAHTRGAAGPGGPELATPVLEQAHVLDPGFGEGVATIGEAVDDQFAHREAPRKLQ